MSSFLAGSLLALISGLMIFSYKGYAEKRGWRIGSVYTKDFSFLKLIAFLALLGGAVEIFFLVKWYWGIVWIIASWLASGLFMAMFREKSQWVSILLLIASVVVYFVVGAEIVNV